MGMSFKTPVTVKSADWATFITLPIGFSSPKNFVAKRSVITRDEVPERAFSGSPLIIGNENILRNEGSTDHMAYSSKALSLYRMSCAFRFAARVESSISGISASRAGPSGWGVQ